MIHYLMISDKGFAILVLQVWRPTVCACEIVQVLPWPKGLHANIFYYMDLTHLNWTLLFEACVNVINLAWELNYCK